MIIIPVLMLAVPGLIAMRIRRSKEELLAENRILLLCEYMIYSLAIVFVSYLFMFVTFPARTVSFSTVKADVSSSIYSASFIVKYSFVSVLAAVLLPHFTDGALAFVSAIPAHLARVREIMRDVLNHRIRAKSDRDKPIK
jgi:hypothetical protein